MSNALEKLTLAYLELRAKHDDLVKQNEELVTNISELNHKYKTAKEQKAFLQTERDKLAADKENYICEHADEIRNLKQCIEELESQLVQLTPKEQRIDEQADGYDDAKRVCRADFKASETTEKADEAIQPVILLRNMQGAWFKYSFFIVKDGKKLTEFLFADEIQDANPFNNLDEVNAFLGDYPLDTVTISHHHPNTLQPLPTEI